MTTKYKNSTAGRNFQPLDISAALRLPEKLQENVTMYIGRDDLLKLNIQPMDIAAPAFSATRLSFAALNPVAPLCNLIRSFSFRLCPVKGCRMSFLMILSTHSWVTTSPVGLSTHATVQL